MKILFVTPESNQWSSSRLRAAWPARYIEGAEVKRITEIKDYRGYDACIFIKVFPLDEFEQLGLGKVSQIWWDVCDPAWWWNSKGCAEIVKHVTGVIASNQGLADDFMDWSGKKAFIIRDRIELEHYPLQKRHHYPADPVRFIWFGAGQNRLSLFAALANLERLAANEHNISLTIYDDWTNQEWRMTDHFPISYLRWSLDQENRVIASHDIALLPPYPGPWGRVKSNNKDLTAWACGLPVSDGQDYHKLEELVASHHVRANHTQWARQLVEEQYDVKQSAVEWMELLNESSDPA